MHIESVQDLLKVIDGMDLVDSGLRVFRGQNRDWDLLPSIGRNSDAVHGYHNWRIFHDDLINKFLRFGHPYLSGYSTAGAEGWVLGQHHGLPTRLLDTTTNPLKALFFAVNQPSEDQYDGAFWVFSYTGWREDLEERHRQHWEGCLVPFFPPQLNARLMAQEGAFISYPLPENCNPLKPIGSFKQDNLSLLKITVHSGAKEKLRRELETLGIQYRLLFPDLDGVARNIRLTAQGT